MTRVALLLALLTACGGSEPELGPDPAAASVAAGRLCSLFMKDGHECTHDGSTITAAGHTVTMTAHVELDASVGGPTALELRYDVAIDGTDYPGLATRGVGGGLSRQEAHEKAAEDWARVFGSGLADAIVHTGKLGVLQALQDEQEPPAAFVSGDWVVYVGWTDLRGNRKEKRPIDVQVVLDKVAPSTQKWSTGPGELHAVLVQINLREGFAPTKECRLDGVLDNALCDAALSYDWPDGSYLLKQYFVFVPGPLPTDVKERPPAPIE